MNCKQPNLDVFRYHNNWDLCNSTSSEYLLDALTEKSSVSNPPHDAHTIVTNVPNAAPRPSPIPTPMPTAMSSTVSPHVSPPLFPPGLLQSGFSESLHGSSFCEEALLSELLELSGNKTSAVKLALISANTTKTTVIAVGFAYFPTAE